MAGADFHVTPQVQRYRRMWLGDMRVDSAGHANPGIEVQELLSPAVLDVPPLEYGHSEFGRAGVVLQQDLGDPVGTRLIRAGPSLAFLLRNAMVHFKYGIVTLGDCVIEESLYHVPMHSLPGAARDGESHLLLPIMPITSWQHSAYHLLACNQDNYFHWLVDVVARFRVADYQQFELDARTVDIPNLLLPPLDTPWKRESIAHSVTRLIPRVILAASDRLFVERLFNMPDLSGAGFNPHPAILDAFNTIRASVLGNGPLPRPWRHLYISRVDSTSRVLTNELEVIDRMVRAGFMPVVLSKLSLPEQVRLFAEASHIVAPHGAGVTNIGFCQSGARLCELQMDSYVHWSFRLLAALRGIRYGCLIGNTVGQRHDWPHSNAWYLNIAALDLVLNDPGFIEG